MTKDEALKLALELIERLNKHGWILADFEEEVYASIASLKAALEQPVQEPVLQEIEQYRMQMAGISTAAIGYWKEGDGIHPDYDTVALRDVAKLYAKYDELYNAKKALAHPPQPVQEQQQARVDVIAVNLMREGINKHRARELADHFVNFTLTPPLPVQEPVAWDKPSASFNKWWDSDRRRDNANPFQTDSFAYWAFEGWQAAQRPWVELKDEEIDAIGDKVANEQLVGPVSNFRVRLAKAIEQTLKERNG